MTRKNLVIEMLPRALFGVMMLCLLLGQYLILWPPKLTDNLFSFGLGAILSIGGFTFWMYIGYHMRVKVGLHIKNKNLIIDGPFQYVRHPMYVSVFIMLIGIGILFFSWSWFVMLFAFIPVWYLECKIEEKYLVKLFGKKYLDYKKRVGMFIPNIGAFQGRNS